MQAESQPPHDQPAPEKPGRRKPGPRPRVTREQIARAALEIGLAEVTIKAVAAHLGMDHSSLYRHVRSRDEIVNAAADLAVSEMDWRSPEGGWRPVLEKLAGALWSLYSRHPGLARAFREMEVKSPASIRGFAEAVARLQADGFAPEDALLAVDTLADALTDSFSAWERFTRAGPDGQSLADAMAGQWVNEALADTEHAGQIGAMVAVMRGTPQDWWLRRQKLILDGIGCMRP